MIYLILSFVFVYLASMSNSIMDTLDHHHSISIFKDFKNPLWWNSDQGWKNKYIDRDPKNGRVKWPLGFNKPVQLTDAWHFFKMLMIVFMCSAIIIITKAALLYNVQWYYYIVLLIGLGTTWNLTFSFFYHKVLLK